MLTNLENRLKKYSSGAFSIHGYIKTSNGQGVTIQARYYTNRTGGNYIGIENLGFISGDTDWNFYYKELTVPNNAKFIDICCSSDPPAAGESFARFDNVGLIEWTEWEPLGAAQTPILSPNDYYYLQIRTSDQFAAVTVQYRETNYGNFLVPASQDLTTKISAAELKKNFPNPFNPTTTISFDLHIPAEVELSVYNIKGQKVRTLLKSQLAAGAWFADWNGKDTNGKPAASGVYFFRLSVNDKPVSAKKCLLLK